MSGRSAVSFGPESGLSLTSALLGMLVFIVLIGLVDRESFATQRLQQENTLAGYYAFLGNALSSTTDTPDQAVKAGILPPEMVQNGK
ncbi:MAG: hypothetical protein OWQ56_10865 [Acidithiobacillus caldus]|nr:hypothetical protein [Acidithiobacillus caldus]